jgi:hypothetical protein
MISLDGPNRETYQVLVNEFLKAQQSAEIWRKRILAFVEALNPDPERYDFDADQVSFAEKESPIHEVSRDSISDRPVG